VNIPKINAVPADATIKGMVIFVRNGGIFVSGNKLVVCQD